MSAADSSGARRWRRAPGISRPGPSLTPEGRILVVAVGLVALLGLEVPPALFVGAGIAIVADMVVAVVWFRPRPMRAALPRQVVDGTAVRCVLDHPGLRDEVLLSIDRSVVAGPWTAEPTGLTEVRVQAPHRGVFPALSVHATLSGPLGLGCCTRRWTIQLPAPHVVTPMATPTDDELASVTTRQETARTQHQDASDHLREYQPGDPVHTVSWATSERHGELLVRSGQGLRPVVRMGVHLGSRPGDAAEAVASRAMDVGARYIGTGAQLVVDVVAPRAADRATAGAAVSAYRAPPAHVPPGTNVYLGRSTVDDPAALGQVLAHAVAAPVTGEHETGRRWPGSVDDGYYDVIVEPTGLEPDTSVTMFERAATPRRLPVDGRRHR